MATIYHTPVLLEYILENLLSSGHSLVVDATLGEGGHSEAFLRQGKTVIAFERDGVLLQKTKARLASYIEEAKLYIIHGNFVDLEQHLADILAGLGKTRVDFFLFDLGISKYHYFESGNGFSFNKDEPLLMTLDAPGSQRNAQQIINESSQEKLAQIFSEFGEETHALRYATAILKQRRSMPFRSSKQLAECLWQAAPRYARHKRIHPATKTFQALRITVNQELTCIEPALLASAKRLSLGGRLCVISYHSLEDRIVKKTFKQHVRKNENYNKYAKQQPTENQNTRIYSLVNKKTVKPSHAECLSNKAARSAKLRTLQHNSAAILSESAIKTHQTPYKHSI